MQALLPWNRSTFISYALPVSFPETWDVGRVGECKLSHKHHQIYHMSVSCKMILVGEAGLNNNIILPSSTQRQQILNADYTPNLNPSTFKPTGDHTYCINK